MKPQGLTEVGPLRKVIVKHARQAYASRAMIQRQWRGLGYAGPPSWARAMEESDRFVALLRELGAEPVLLPADPATGLDSIYVRDAALVSAGGLILCRMGKEARSGEPDALARGLEALGIEVHGAITGVGRLEGGDVVWLDRRTVAVGRGYRTNDQGIRQLEVLLEGSIEELIVVPLPHWRGPGDVFHLMSIFSPLDRDLALVHSPLLPVPFRELLLERGFRLLEVPPEEFDTMGCNVLAVAPRRCVAVAGNPLTRALLERAGVEVHVYEGDEISHKGAGGPTCLTRPLVRASLRRPRRQALPGSRGALSDREVGHGLASRAVGLEPGQDAGELDSGPGRDDG